MHSYRLKNIGNIGINNISRALAIIKLLALFDHVVSESENVVFFP